MATKSEIEALVKIRDNASAQVKRINKELKRMGAGTKAAKKQAVSFSSAIKSMGTDVTGLNPKIFGLAGALGAVALGVKEGVQAFSAYEKSVTRIETLVGRSREEVAQMSSAVRTLGPAIGRGPQELSAALFDITSAGQSGASALKTLEAAGKAAAIGLGSTKVVADAATSIMNAYGKTNVSATKAVDVLLTTVREGKTAPEELAASLGKVIPIAATMGISIEEVGAGVASLTRVGFNSAEAVTGLRGAMVAILKPSEQATDVLKTVGLKMDDVRSSIKERGLLATLQELRSQLTDEQFVRFIGRAEAAGAALAITGDRAAETANILKSLNASSGATEKAFKRVEDTSAQTAARVSASWEEAKLKVGELFFAWADFSREFSKGVQGAAFGFPTAELEKAKSAIEGIRKTVDTSLPAMADLEQNFEMLSGHSDSAAAALIKSNAAKALAAKEAAAAAAAAEKLAKQQEKAAAAALKHRQHLDGLIKQGIKPSMISFRNLRDAVEPLPKSYSKLAETWRQSLQQQIKNVAVSKEHEKALIKAQVQAQKLGLFPKKLKPITLETIASKEAMDDFASVIETASGASILFGQSISRAMASAAGSIAGAQKLFGGGRGVSGFLGDFKKAGKISIGSFTEGLSKNLPAIGAIAGPAFQLFKKIFGKTPRWKEIAKEGATQFGKAFSEILSKALQSSEKALGSLQNAIAANIGDVIAEVGVNVKNLGQSLQSVSNLIGMVQNGTIKWSDAAEQLDKAFGPVKDQLLKMGTEGLFKLGQLVNKMKELGTVSAEVQDFIKEKAGAAVQAFSGFFKNLAENENLTAKEAKNALGVVSTAFQAAITAGGGLLGAIQQLGPNFGGVLTQLRSVLGEENAVLNQMSSFYNFVSNNSEQLAAIQSLGTAFKELAGIGMINAANIGSFGQTFVDEFNRVLGATENQKAAFAAMGPQIGQLLEAYNELGVKVPPDLAKIAEEATKAGANLMPPEGTEDILKDIRDVMVQIGEALGVATGKAKGFGSALGGISGVDMPPSAGTPPPGFAAGGVVRARPGGKVIRVAEAGRDEAIVPIGRGGGSAGGGTGGAVGGGVTIEKLIVVAEGGVISTPQELAAKLQPAGLELFEDPRIQKKLLDLAASVSG